jgi:hypothetical protein
MKETIHFYKYVEVLRSFPLHRESLKIHTEDVDAKKAIKLVRGDIDEQNDIPIALADFVIADVDVSRPSNANGLSMYESVREVLKHQKKNGSLLLHISDLFGSSTIQLLYLIASCYSMVYIYTPMIHTEQTKFIMATQLHTNIDLPFPPKYTFNPTQLFLTKLIEINTIIGQKRLEQTRFNTTCDYECVIWKSKFLNGLHNVNVDFDRRGYQIQERSKTPHGDAVN